MRFEVRGAKIVHLPQLHRFAGDRSRKVSPLSHFLTFVADLVCVQGGRVWVNPRRIHVSPSDADMLYAMTRTFYISVYGEEEGARICAQAWVRGHPREVPGIPPGHAMIESGTVYIEKKDVTKPALSH